MPRICVLITSYGSNATAVQHCIAALNKQSCKPADIIIATNADAAVQSSSKIPLHRVQANTPAEGRAKGMQLAFEDLKADFVWELEAASTPDKHCLQALLNAQGEADCVSLPLCLSAADTPTQPLCIRNNGSKQVILNTEDLPQSERVEIAHTLPGGLYPRAAWMKVGLPTPQLIMQGEMEEYAAKLCAEGFKLQLVPGAKLRYTDTVDYLCYKVGDELFTYRIGKTLEEHYYRMRNRAWIERVIRRKQYLRRLISCGFYMLNTLRAMLQSGEFSLKRAYLVFRGQHNGFYGKLRPY